jgi:hypothetical protein
VGYKGAHLGEPEKKNIGEHWEEKSGGRAQFQWAVKRDAAGRTVFQQIAHKLAQARNR